jgi:hypothetical protein
VLIAVCQGRKRRDAAAVGAEQHGRSGTGQSKCYRFYVRSGKCILAAMYLRRVQVVYSSSAAAPTYASTVVTSPAPAAQIPGCNFVSSTEIRKANWGRKSTQARKRTNFQLSLVRQSAEPPCTAVGFIVNSEPHTGARLSVRLCRHISGFDINGIVLII